MTHIRLPRLAMRLLLLALLPGLACRAVTDLLQEPAPASPAIPATFQAPPAEEEPLQEQAASCPAVTESILSAATEFEEESGKEVGEEPEAQYLVTFFVLSAPPPGNNIAEEKILFFYEYPELVQMRASILANICASLL